MFGIPVGLIFYGVLFAFGAAALYGVVRSHDNGVRDELKAHYVALIGKCEESKRTPAQCAKEWTDAVGFNVSLQAENKEVRALAKTCSDKTLEGNDLTAKAEADKARRLGRSEGYRDGLAKANAEAETRLTAAPGPPKTCQQTLTSVGAALKAVATQRIRFALGLDDTPPAEDDGVKVK